VWLFDTSEAFAKFDNQGWELGAQTTAVAKLGAQGAAVAGAISVSPGGSIN